jgi:WD40 repeat protein
MILYAILLALIVAGLLFGFATVGVILAIVTGLLLLIGTAWFVHFRWSQPALKRNQVEAAASRPVNIMFASFIPNGQILIVNSESVIECYAPERWTRLSRLGRLPAYTSHHALSEDGRFLAWAKHETDGEQSSISLSEINTGNQVLAVEFDGYLSSVVISPNGSLFGLVDHIKGIHLWDGKVGKPVPVFVDTRSRAVSFVFAEFLVFSPDGRFLSGGEEDAVYIWDLEAKELVQVLGGHSHISALSHSPDGTSLAVANDGKVRIWDIDSGEQLRVIERLYGVRHLIFSLDGRFLAGDSNTQALWLADANTGARLADSYVSVARFRSLSFSPDGRQLLALSEGARLYRWLLDDHGRFLSTEVLSDSNWVPTPTR